MAVIPPLTEMPYCEGIGKYFENAATIHPKDDIMELQMVTSTGIIINLKNLEPDQIRLEDIAHGLAHNGRWNGHAKRFYSVAEHLIRCAEQAEPKDKLLALFHDAEEAYWGDTIKPIKMFIERLCPQVTNQMRETRRAIFRKFQIEDDGAYKPIDESELFWEFENLVLRDGHCSLDPNQAKHEWLFCARTLFAERSRLKT